MPVIAGVVFATYGDYYFTTWGLVLTLTGTLLAALKTIVTNRIQVGRLKLHPLDLLIRMSPLAFVQCVFFSWYSGELDRVRLYSETEMTQSKVMALVINGAIAFGLNVVSFTANKKTSPLTMTVAGELLLPPGRDLLWRLIKASRNSQRQASIDHYSRRLHLQPPAQRD